MGWDLTGIGSALDFAKGLMDRFWPPQASESEKLAAASQIAPLIEQRENQIVEAQKEIIVAELSQGDNYTKRARPTIIYAGLSFVFLVHVFFPLLEWVAIIFGRDLSSPPSLILPEAFWWTWGSVCGVYALGRSAEKKGISNELVRLITGSK